MPFCFINIEPINSDKITVKRLQLILNTDKKVPTSIRDLNKSDKAIQHKKIFLTSAPEVKALWIQKQVVTKRFMESKSSLSKNIPTIIKLY